MNLYAVVNHSGSVQGQFPNKKSAKISRDDQNGGTFAEIIAKEKTPQYHITMGPDHWKYDLPRGKAYTEPQLKKSKRNAV